MRALVFQILLKEKRRFFIGAMGVAFAVVLMLMQIGFQNALFESSSLIHSKLNCDLVMIAPNSSSLINMEHFTERRLCQALACPNVASVSPLYVGVATCSSKYGQGKRRTLILAFKPEDKVFKIPGIENEKNKLHADERILYDEYSRPEFGPLPELFRAGKPVSLQLSNHKLVIAGLFRSGSSFGADGNIVTSDRSFFHIGFQQNRKPGIIDIGLIRLKDKTRVESTQAQLKSALPADVLILSKAQFVNFEKNYWRQSTPVGFIFSIGVMLGLIVGAVIVYQILYAGVNDHLAEYATLKAIGYSNSYLTDLILQEAIILALAGFLPGLMVSAYLYELTHTATGLPMQLCLDLELFVVALSIVMCSISALLASLRLRTADPVDCF